MVLRSAFMILVLAGSFFAVPANPGKFLWRGTVDDRIQLVIRAEKLESHTISGKQYPDGVYSFTAPLAQQPVTVNVKMLKGRGSAKVIEQPVQDNDFTAVVEIVDEKGGAKEYQLEIFWN